MSNEKRPVICPYCGGEMRHKTVEFQHVLFHFFKCEWGVCGGGTSPKRLTLEKAYKAATARWQEPNRVLTLEEVIADANADSWKFEWVELKGEKDIIHQTCPFIVNTERTIFASPGDKRVYRGDNSNYGVTWRCWLRKPTAVDLAGTPWEDEDER